MDNNNEYDDPTFMNCKWIGKGKKVEDSSYVYYEAAEVVRISDGLKRRFRRGDAVYVAGEKSGEIWIAHLVELFDLCDNSIESMRCTLRWLYDPPKGVSKPRGMKPGCREVYFSDHVEECSNSVTAIHGRAFLCATLQEMDNVLKIPPKSYWEGDVICFVRFFYYSNFDRRVRLKNGELKFLLNYPSTDSLHNVIAPVSDESGSEMNTQTALKSTRDYPVGTSDSHANRHSTGAEKRRNSKVTKSKRGCEGVDEISFQSRGGKIRRRVVQESSEDDSDTNEVGPSRAMRSLSRGTSRTIEKSTKSPKQPLQMPKTLVEEVTRSPVKMDSGSDGAVVTEPNPMQMAWHNVEESFKSIPPDEPVLIEETFKTMLHLMTSTMIEKQLDFDMGEGDRKAVATLAAQQMFGELAGSDASRDGSRMKSARSRGSRTTKHK